MSARKFKFISPGVFLNEIDNSQLPNQPRETGPLFVGRSKYGPAMRPVTVDSFAEFVQLYGEPIPGGKADDVWRNGNEQTPTYGTYAAQAWLRNSSTCTYMRLLGSQNLNATDAGKAGWKIEGASPLGKDIEAIPTFPGDATGSAYGLFVFQNNLSGTQVASAHGTGSLVATWYVEDGIIGLVGTETGGTSIPSIQAGSGSCRLVSTNTNGVFTVSITGSSKNSYKNRVISFSLNENNKNYIRNVFNTNPAAVNTTVTKGNQRERYWLGETYAREFLQKVERKVVTGSGGGMLGSSNATYIGLMLPLATGSAVRHSDRQIPFEDGATRYNPATGLVFGQDLGGAAAATAYAYGDTTPLFKFHALDHAEWAQNNLKISIANINYSQDQFNKFGTFDVLVRRANDTDAAPIVVERFSNCNLDANSLDYIARKIGDSYVQFDSTTRRLVTRGEHLNNSKYIRVEMEAENYNPELLPFGYYGPLKYKDFEITKTTNESQDNFGTGVMGLGAKNVLASNYVPSEGNSANCLILTGSGLGGSGANGPELKILYPSHELRISGNQEGLAGQKDAYWGVWTGITKNSGKFNRDFADLNRNRTDTITEQLADTAYSEYQFIFTLDEICSGSTTGLLTWVSGSRRAAVSGDRAISAQTDFTYKNVIDKGVDRFTMPLYGGSDGLDITERDPFRNTLLNGKTETTNYAYNSVKEAVDIIRDSEFVPYNLVSIPGITNEQLTTHLINTAEARADALAVIDLKGDFQPSHEGNEGKTYPNLSETITNLKDRQINSSYGCAYYPFVQVRDTLQGQLVYMPSSVTAIGAMSYTDRVRAPWFAPAGFNRGGLSTGIAGIPVVNVTQKLTAQDRNKLYDANINPIASFPNEGIVIFGQKTLQVTRSALDRINVRRLMIFIKKGISNIASGILFEPNVRATWARFIGQANPFLADVQARFGLDEYKLVLDETTTTPDLVDRNILYAKVYLKPTRTIEFVAVDFIITNTGASFED
jgi:phage tail sheath protein FI